MSLRTILQRDRRIFDIYDCLFLILVVLSACLRVEHLFSSRMWPDEALYSWYAKQIFHNPCFIFSKEFPFPPVGPVLMALGYFLLPPDMAERYSVFCISIAGLFVMYILARKCGSKFMALVSVAVLSISHSYFCMGTYILLDMPLTLGYMILALSLLSAARSNDIKKDIRVGVVCVFLILTKWSALLAVFVVVIFYLKGLQEKNVMACARRLLIPMLLAFWAFAYLALKNYLQLGYVVPSLTALKGAYNVQPADYYFKYFELLLPKGLWPIALWGVVVLFRRKSSLAALLTSWIFVVFVFVSFTTEKSLRYMLPVVPALILVAGVGLDALVEWLSSRSHQKRIGLMMIVFVYLSLILWHEYSQIQYDLRIFDQLSVGFKEAGRWLKRYQGKDVLIFAGSIRAIRYYSDIDFRENGGQIVTIPQNQDAFKQFVLAEHRPLLFEVDCWEYTQPSWIYPLGWGKIKFLKDLGFRFARVINSPYNTNIPVVWIFYRPINGGGL